MAIKQFTWYGKTEEELRAMDLKDFMVLLPARKRRSLKRGFTPAQNAFLRSVHGGQSNLKTHCRNMVIIPAMLGKMIKVYNGKEWVPVMITIEMLGHRLGDFSQTRKGVTHSAAGIGATRSSKAVSAR